MIQRHNFLTHRQMISNIKLELDYHKSLYQTLCNRDASYKPTFGQYLFGSNYI